MKVLMIGSGGREHALVKKLLESDRVDSVICAPGNGGISLDAECFNVSVMDIDGMISLAAEQSVDFVFVAPDDPLAAGMVDAFEKEGFKCFGPSAAAARIESSKVFSKNLMKKYGIPTASYEVFSEAEKAISYIEQQGKFPVVVKADGLALGKGVIIAENMAEAADAVKSIMEDKVFGASGNNIVVEEFLTGPEVSVLAFTDGKTVKPMVSSMDHKRAGDNDTGLNTGGMGTIAPNPYYTEEVARRCTEEIFLPTINAMNTEGRTFKGCLYFGLMITKDGPKVIEYNCRFGDPETQVVLPLLESDLLTVMKAVTEEKLSETEVKFSDKSACCVITASNGYPSSYKKGFEITFSDEALAATFIAGAKEENGKLVTSGGRVTGTTAIAPTLEEAVKEAYRLSDGVKFEGAYRRSDIGRRALQAK